MPKVNLLEEVDSNNYCRKCPKCEIKQVYTADEFEDVESWKCSAVNKFVAEHVYLDSHIEIPNWCPIKAPEDTKEEPKSKDEKEVVKRRVLKFRAWSEEDGCFSGGFAIHGTGLISDCIDAHIESSGLPVSDPHWGENDLIVEQYTGLFDKNGKEICEGDIIRSYSKGKEVVHTVDFSESNACFCCWLHPIDKKINSPMSINKNWLLEFKKEIIGNIHNV